MKYQFIEGKAGRHPVRESLQEVLNDIPLKYAEWVLKGCRKGKHGRMIVSIKEKVDAPDTGSDQAANG